MSEPNKELGQNEWELAGLLVDAVTSEKTAALVFVALKDTGEEAGLASFREESEHGEEWAQAKLNELIPDEED